MVRTDPPLLTQQVPLDYLAAVQAIAALEDRIREYQHYADRGADVGFVVTDAQRAVVAIREAFRLYPRGAREAMAEATAERDPYGPVADDTSPQLLRYQAEGR